MPSTFIVFLVLISSPLTLISVGGMSFLKKRLISVLVSLTFSPECTRHEIVLNHKFKFLTLSTEIAPKMNISSFSEGCYMIVRSRNLLSCC